MSSRSRWTSVCAGATALVVAASALVGCTGDAEDSAAPRPTSSFDGHPVLQPWASAMRGSDDEAANVVVLGDSVSEGFGFEGHLERRWVDRLQRALRARAGVEDCSTEPAGFHGTTSLVPPRYQAPSLPQPRRAGRTAPRPSAGPGGRAIDLKPGGSVTWEVDARSVDVGYRTQPDGAPLRVSIDGQVPMGGVAVPTEADGDEGKREVWSSGDLGPGTHTVTVRNSGSVLDGALATVTDLTPFVGDRDRCVHVLDASRSGVSARAITKTPAYLADSLSFEPDLLLVPLGFNDARSGSTPAEFGRTLDRLIGQVRDQGYDGPVLLIGWFTPRWGDDTLPWDQYVDAMSKRKSHPGVSFLDLSVVLPPVAGAPQGVYMDGLHPGSKGQPLIAASLLEALAPGHEVEGTNAPERD